MKAFLRVRLIAIGLATDVAFVRPLVVVYPNCGGRAGHAKNHIVHMFGFLRSFIGQLSTLITGSVLSAVLMVYGLLSGKALPTWLGFCLTVAFVVWAAFRVRNEEAGRRLQVESARDRDKAEYISSLRRKDEEINDLEHRLAAALEDRNYEEPFVQLEIIEVPGITNFIYHNIGKQPAYGVRLALLGQELTVTTPSVHLSPDEKKNILIDCEQAPEARTLFGLIDHIQQTGFSTIAEWAASGKVDIALKVSITFQDPKGNATATDWKIRRNLLAIPASSHITITPLGMRRLTA